MNIFRDRPKGQTFTQASMTNPHDGFKLSDMVTAAATGIPLSSWYSTQNLDSAKVSMDRVLTTVDFKDLPEDVYIDFADRIQAKLELADQYFDSEEARRREVAERSAEPSRSKPKGGGEAKTSEAAPAEEPTGESK